MTVDSWTKLAVVVIVCVAATVLGYFGKIDSQAVVALLSAALGYVFGNAHGVMSANKGYVIAELPKTQSNADRLVSEHKES